MYTAIICWPRWTASHRGAIRRLTKAAETTGNVLCSRLKPGSQIYDATLHSISDITRSYSQTRLRSAAVSVRSVFGLCSVCVWSVFSMCSLVNHGNRKRQNTILHPPIQGCFHWLKIKNHSQWVRALLIYNVI